MLAALPEWPVFGMADDVRPVLFQARSEGSTVVLATLTAVEGGGPRPVGTQMAFTKNIACGYFSGGCVEADVAGHAESCLEDGAPRRLVYGEGSPWPDIQLLCGARIEILLERVEPDDPALAALLAATEARKPVVWVTDGVRRACAAAPEVWDGAISRPYDPYPRLAVVGGNPVAMAIAMLGAQAGFETTLIRPKGPAEPPPIGGVAYSRDTPAQALAAIGLDPWTAVAVASHEIENDQEAMHAALTSPAGYVGLLGGRSRLQQRLARLRAYGLGEADFARLHAPIGLDIGGKAPWEVAVSVIAEIVRERYARGSASTSTTSPAAAADAPAGLRNRASATAKMLTSEES